MAEPAPALVDIEQSPLRVHRRDGKLVAEDPSGAMVFSGTPGARGAPEVMVIETAAGSWRIQRRADRVNQVLDRAGQPVATLRRRLFRSTLIELPDGETIPVSSGQFRIFQMGCRIGRLATARAPFLRPGRYFKLTLRDELLKRPDRQLIVALGSYLAESSINSQIFAAQRSPTT
ncbi:MAG TPA: hypothetical protein VG708_02170 [Mycobacteriales bacterium]|nr:hypothetical protein [Mycobacteriales bacterium]